jgi:hypothetical protein
MIRTQMGRTIYQKMVAFAWDALYDATRNSNQYYNFEVFMAVCVWILAFWVLSCSPEVVHQRFEDTYCFHLQG